MKNIETYGFTAEQVSKALNGLGRYFFNIACQQYQKGNYTAGIKNTVQAAFDITAQFYTANGGKLAEGAIDGKTYLLAAEKLVD